MKLFSCPSCGATLYFRNSGCSTCGASLAYSPLQAGFVAGGVTCANRSEIACNWAVDDAGEELCHSCRMTEVVPDLSIVPNAVLWGEAEMAKRWALATLGFWGWFGPEDAGLMPEFHFKSEHTRHGSRKVMMGHANGVITINVAEADDAVRVRNREMLGEEYRTMLGHMRHELAHFLFDRLIEEPGFAEAFRAMFGDERADYGDALERYYSEGPTEGWEQRHITPYASAHPHEDWAETVAHILHLVDMVDSAVAAGLTWPSAYTPPEDAYATTDADALIHTAVDLGMISNQLTRSMGLSDLYPFVLAGPVRDKLEFAHFWLNRPARTAGASG